MNGEFTVELRGNGVLLKLYEIPLQRFEYLESLAERYGEPFSTAWFDPMFVSNVHVHNSLKQIVVKREYRGLLVEKHSFLEIRRLGKKRVKYRTEQLIGVDLLFPLVEIQPFQITQKDGYVLLYEFTYGTGCLAKFQLAKFNLGDLNFFSHKAESNLAERLVLLNNYNGQELSYSQDDFVVRRTTILPSIYS